MLFVLLDGFKECFFTKVIMSISGVFELIKGGDNYETEILQEVWVSTRKKTEFI